MKIELIEHFKKRFVTLKQGYNHDKKTCSHSRHDLLPVNVQISSDILVCLFQSQLWQATSTSWSTSCPSSLMPSWTLRKGKISLIRPALRWWWAVDSTGRCCCVVLECVPAQNSVSASLYSCPFSGGGSERLFKALWQWPNATNTDIKDSGPCTQSHMTKPSFVFVKQDVTEQLRVISSAC